MGRIMHDSELVKTLKSHLNEIISDQQKRYEDQGLVFIANVDPKDKTFQIFARKGWQGIRYGKAYDIYAVPVPGLKAMYGLPWYR